MMSPGISKFLLMMALILAVVFGTRWVILHYYSQSDVPTDLHRAEAWSRIAGPRPTEEEAAATPAAPPVPTKLDMPASSSPR